MPAYNSEYAVPAIQPSPKLAFGTSHFRGTLGASFSGGSKKMILCHPWRKKQFEEEHMLNMRINKMLYYKLQLAKI